MRCDRKGVTTGVWRNERVKGRGKTQRRGRREKMKTRLGIRTC